MSNILETIKKQLHTLTMTDEERADIRLHVASHMHSYKPASHRIPSPYTFGIWHKRLSVITAVFLIVMITGGTGLAYASNDALPGDVLYSVKVNVTEEVQAAVKPTSQARAEFEVKRVEKRLGEAVTLAAQGKLDDKKKETITENLERHTQKVSEETIKLIKERPDDAVEVSTKLALSLEAHAAAITTAQEQKKVDGELDTIVQQASAAKDHANVEKAAATEALVGEGKTAIAINDVIAKKDRLEKLYASVFELDAVANKDQARVIITAAVTVQNQIDALFAQANESIDAENATESFLTLQKVEELLVKIDSVQKAEKNIGAALTAGASVTEQTADQKETAGSTVPVTSVTSHDTTTATGTIPVTTETTGSGQATAANGAAGNDNEADATQPKR